MRKVCGVVWTQAGRGGVRRAARGTLLRQAAARRDRAGAAPGLEHGVRRASTRRATSGTGAASSSGRSRTRRSPCTPNTAPQLPTWKSTMHLYAIDGAASRVANDATAWAYRDAIWGGVFAGVDPDPANAGAIRDWVVEYSDAIKPYGDGRRLRQLPHGRAGSGPRHVRLELRPARARQGAVRPGQRLPRQPEHRARGVGGLRTGRAGGDLPPAPRSS